MIIREMRLAGFRNYAQAAFAPASGITVLHGENAQGKTNLIEAIYLCCVGRSGRTARDQELVRWGDRFAQVAITAERLDGVHDVTVRIIPQDKRKKVIKINGSPAARLGELMGHVNAVLFSPEDLRLVKEGPEGRRRFLDMAISQLSPGYFYALQRYIRALNQRNGLLKSLMANPSGSLSSTLDEWDALLAEAGGEVITRRARHVKTLKEAARETHAMLSGGREILTLAYESGAENAEELLHMLRAARKEDVRRGTTSHGPHRDDLRMTLCGHDTRAFASQGQQRTAALSLKLAELDVMREVIGESPVLLLDDVMSELDVNRRKMLLRRMRDVQTLITCTHMSDLGGAVYEAAYRVKEGTISSEEAFHL
ncbi:MAG: DNA replication/repair protein RecF [Firmicutes bacterium]|nr:DNA replication/repair protein RecF [Bacillota bacterium]